MRRKYRVRKLYKGIINSLYLPYDPNGKTMKILLKIAIVAVAAAFMAGCCNCRSYQKKTRRPLAGTEWQLIQLGGKAVKPEEGKFTVTLLAEVTFFIS